MKAFEIFRYVWNDDPCRGGRHERERIGVCIGDDVAGIQEQLAAKGYSFDTPSGKNFCDTYYEIDTYPVEIIT